MKNLNVMTGMEFMDTQLSFDALEKVCGGMYVPDYFTTSEGKTVSRKDVEAMLRTVLPMYGEHVALISLMDLTGDYKSEDTMRYLLHMHGPDLFKYLEGVDKICR